MIVMIAFVGLTLDTGLGYLAGSQLQNAADASSLAAVQKLGTELEVVQSAAQSIASKNYAAAEKVLLRANPGNSSNGDIVIGIYDRQERTFTPDLNNPNAVRVVARRTAGSLSGSLPLVFGPIFGIDTIDIERVSIAMLQAGEGDAAIIVLNRDDPRSLDMDSNAQINVENGGVHVNSSHRRGLYMDSNAEINADSLTISGGAVFRSNADVDVDSYTEGATQVADPLAELEPPPLGPDLGRIHLDSNQKRTVSPGYYSGGISLDSNTRLTLRSGIYVLDGVGLRLRSNSTIRGEGVTLIIVNDQNRSSSLDIDSNGDVLITPPDDGPYAGISVFQSRDNTNDAIINSNGDLDVSGVIYFPKNRLELDSNADQLGTQLIVDRLKLDSNARINVDYEGSETSGPKGIFLVQ